MESAHKVIVEYTFHNPDVNLGLEVVDLAHLRSRLSPSARVALHRSDFHQLFVVTAGHIESVVDFTALTRTRGTALYVRPGQVLLLPSPGPGSAAVAVLFTPDFPQRLPPLDGILGPVGAATYEPPNDDRHSLTAATDELASTYAAALARPQVSVVHRTLLRQMLGSILLRLAMGEERPGDHHDTAATETVRRFRAELERSFATTRSASVYAHRLGHSPRTLNRACLSVTGHSAKELIDARVALEAKRLLVHTTAPTMAIARRLGFSEATNFTKFFTRMAATTPSAFRAAHQTASTHNESDPGQAHGRGDAQERE